MQPHFDEHELIKVHDLLQVIDTVARGSSDQQAICVECRINYGSAYFDKSYFTGALNLRT